MKLPKPQQQLLDRMRAECNNCLVIWETPTRHARFLTGGRAEPVNVKTADALAASGRLEVTERDARRTIYNAKGE